jgi:asparagine synthase (glutamine-hydrolysing)
MCGIVGIFDTCERRPVEAELVGRMNARQFHRGPDEGGVHCEPGVGLGHRRLSIIDLSAGQQPLFNEDGTVVVVFNGEIYNYRDLVSELTALGHTFRTHSDTETIVHAWEEWGEDCVRRFRGMFAFAIHDRNRETLFLARDRFGKKPLYYSLLPNGRLIFSSELKALLEISDLSHQIDATAVEDFLAFGYIPDPKSILKSVRKLPPAHTLAWRRGVREARPREYWDLEFGRRQGPGEAEATRELVERLREAVRVRLVSEVPLGAFLSGGVDSSAVVAMMAGVSTEPVKTCSISFGDPEFNEAQYAREVAERYRTDHRVQQVESDDFDLIDKLAEVYDEPFADSSAIPTYRVCELARRNVTVALSGDGGDEVFAGYRRYRWHVYEERVRRRLPQILRGPLFGFLGRAYPKADWAPKILRAKTTFQALARDSLAGYFHSVSVMPDALRRSLYSPSFRRSLDGYEAIDVLRAHASRTAGYDPLSRAQYLDFKTYLPGDILVKVDRASMAHALEVRAPLLDHELVEWAAGLAPALRFANGEPKYIFKRAMEPFVSKDILYRPKMGFAVPIASWFRGPLRERVRAAVLGKGLLETGWFNPAALERMVSQHESGLRDHSAALWSLMMLEASHRRLVSGRKLAA